MERTIQRAQEKTAAATAPVIPPDTPEGKLRRELQRLQRLLNETISRGCQESDRAEQAKREFKIAKAGVDACTRDSERIAAAIRQVIQQLQALNSKSFKGTRKKISKC